MKIENHIYTVFTILILILALANLSAISKNNYFWYFEEQKVKFKMPDKYLKKGEEHVVFDGYVFSKDAVKLTLGNAKTDIFSNYLKFIKAKKYDEIMTLMTKETTEKFKMRFQKCPSCKEIWKKDLERIEYLKPVLALKLRGEEGKFFWIMKINDRKSSKSMPTIPPLHPLLVYDDEFEGMMLKDGDPIEYILQKMLEDKLSEIIIAND